VILLAILLSIQIALGCTILKENKKISKDTKTCSKTYYLSKGISITEDDLTIDCKSSILQGTFQGETGITIQNKKNICIKNCMIMNYYQGIQIRNCTNITITNTALIRNQIGIQLYDSHNNTFSNNRDISLIRPVKETESFDNIFYYENKNLNADFCRYNTCNEKAKQPRKISTIKQSLRKILMKAIRDWINTY